MNEGKLRAGVIRRAAITFAGFYLTFALAMFLPAGIRRWRGWLFLSVYLVLTIVSCVYLWRANPDIFVARTQIGKGTKSWDKVLMVLVLASFFAIFVVAGSDARAGTSNVPAWATILGYVVFVFGSATTTWVCAVNKFAEPSVRIQSERGHMVIETGPYAIVRHPLYLFSAFLIGGIPLMLGSYRAFLPVAIGAVVLIVRTVLEDRLLQHELEGYKSYAARVRYRLIPGVW